MRSWGTAAVSFAAAVVALAAPCAGFADPPAAELTATTSDDTSPPPTVRVGYGALPGGLHALTAETLPTGTVAVATLSGYGYRTGLLSPDHKFTRLLGDVAFAYAPIANLSVGLSFDGRHDKHTGTIMSTPMTPPSDDSYVGDPHLLVRFAQPVGRISVGAQVGIWAPGNNAPSLVAKAISVDGRALLSIDAGFGTLSLDAGYRVDNSINSATNIRQFSLDDQVSLGISQFSAVLAAASLRVPVGPRAYVELEGSLDKFVGSNAGISAPGQIVRGGALVGVAITDAISAVAFVETAKVPSITRAEIAGGTVPIIPYEPTFTGGLGLQARFGGPERHVHLEGPIKRREKPAPVIVNEYADVSGLVFDDVGKPVVGANVTITLKNNTGNAVTDGKGVYTIAKLPIGKTIDGVTTLDDTGAEVAVEVANKKPGSTTLILVRGANSVPPITLESLLPPGQLRGGIINAANSRPIAGATVVVEPGGATQTSGPDGKFTIDLPPGHYKLTVTAKGMASQTLDVNIEQNGVAIKNIELHK